ncbi:MAG TPA: carbon monoxide dehydrogenase subunit G [Thermoanaerobaculia bacterium]|nr:carbon monoxide dehydrogenase subunit G [Thermoanaerobaculia bacterium]
MALKVSGEHLFEAPRATVWRAVTDPTVLARILPGCESLEQVAENQFKGALNIKVGPVQGRFAGEVNLAELVPPESYQLAVKGQGPAGFVEGHGRLSLAEQGSGTLLSYDLDAQVGGRIASVGQRLLDSSARVVARQALEELARQLPFLMPASPEPGGAPATAEAAVAPQAPTQAEFAARVARGVVADLVPPEKRPLVIGLSLVLLLLIVLLLMRAC